MSVLLPVCRHRGLHCENDRWVCRSPKLVIPGGLVSADDCSSLCPFVDHPVEDRPAQAAQGPRGGREPLAVSPIADGELAIAVITANRPIATLARTISELRSAGFSQTVRVFAEPGVRVPAFPGVVAFPSAVSLGAWGNWMRAARTLLDETEAASLLICEDDVAFAPCARLALNHAIRTLPRKDWGYASLYTPIHHLAETWTSTSADETEGWRAIDLVDRDYWGALAYCFTRESLEAAMAHDRVLGHRERRGVDFVVSRVLRELGRHLYFHVPSLADHTGKGISSLGHPPLPGSLSVGFSAEYQGYLTRDADPGETSAVEVLDGRVTVIVATYDCAEYLAGCLASLQGQTVPCEIVVVDDGSRDETAEVLLGFEDHVRVVRHPENRGARAARRTGLRMARTEWVVMADADAQYEPEFVETLLRAADRGVSVVSCSWQRQVADGGGGGGVVRARPFDVHRLWWDNGISMSSLVRRSALPEALGDSDDLDDWSLWLELASRQCRFRTVDRVLFRALERAGGKTAGLRRDPSRYLREVARLRRAYARLIGLEGRIAVVIPARDCLDLTERCLQHLAWYSGLPLEVFYVDNGSAPEVPERVGRMAESLGLPLAIIRNTSNRQFTAAVNQGFRFAEGRHVLCLNNDCFVGPECLERLYWHLTRTGPRVAAVGPLTGDGESQSLRRPHRRAQAGLPDDLAIDLDDPLAGARAVRGPLRGREEAMVAFFCTLFHRDALKDCGLLDEENPAFGAGLGADDEWCLRATQRGWKVLLALDAFSAHLGHQSFQRLEIDRLALQAPALAAFRKLAGSCGHPHEPTPGELRATAKSPVRDSHSWP